MRSLVIVSVAGLAACGSDPDPDFPRACDESTVDGDCIEYFGEGWTEVAVQAECAGGEVLESCPDGALGTCRIDDASGDWTVSYFYPQFWNGSQAAQQCVTRGGTWTDA